MKICKKKQLFSLQLLATHLIVFLSVLTLLAMLPTAVFAQSAEFEWGIAGGNNPRIEVTVTDFSDDYFYEWQFLDENNDILRTEISESEENLLFTTGIPSGQKLDLRLTVKHKDSLAKVSTNTKVVAIPKLEINGRCEGDNVEVVISLIPEISFFSNLSNPEVRLFENVEDGGSPGFSGSELPYTYEEGQPNRTYLADVTFNESWFPGEDEVKLTSGIIRENCDNETITRDGEDSTDERGDETDENGGSGGGGNQDQDDVDEETDTGNEVTQAQGGSENYKFLEPIPGIGEEIGVDGEFSLYVKDIITLVIGFAILAAIIMIVVAGFEYLTSVSQDKTGAAKERIANAVIGLVLALASVVILQTINPQLIELKTVSTVTTSGSTFIIPEFGAYSVHPAGNDDDGLPDTHGNQYCFFIDGEASIGEWTGIFSKDDDRFVCYEKPDECEAGRDKAIKVEGTGGGGVETSCGYYFEATAIVAQDPDGWEVWDIDGNGQIDQVYIRRADPDKNKAIAKCVAQVELAGAENPGWDSFQSFLQGWNEELTQDIDTYCVNGPLKVCRDIVRSCSLTTEEEPTQPAPLPEGWNEAQYCPTTVFNDSNSACKAELSACEVESTVTKECYRTPTQMYGKTASCTDCWWVNRKNMEETPLADRFKYDAMCSGDKDYCRLDNGLIKKLEAFDTAAIASNFDYEITEVFPPTVQHGRQCHYEGTCVDIGVRPPNIRSDSNYSLKVSYIDAIVSAAKKAEMKACYEVNTKAEKNAILEEAAKSGVESLDNSNVIYVDVAVNHFSVYKNANTSCRGS